MPERVVVDNFAELDEAFREAFAQSTALAFDPNLAPKNAEVVAYATSLVVKTTAGLVFSIDGYNSGPAQWIQVHDSATVPATGAVPKIIVAVGATANYSIDYGTLGKVFANGIYVCNSTTGPTKTIGAADCWITARYL